MGLLAPLVLLVFLGFLAGRFLKVNREALAPLLVYFLAPLTIFKGILEADLSAELLSLPFLYIALCGLIASFIWRIGGYFFQSPARNVLAYAGGNANSGYFGFPAVIAVLGMEAFPAIVLISFGFVIFEATIGFYITARSHFTPWESLKKLARLPVLYVFFLGWILNSQNVGIPSATEAFFEWIKGSFTVLGMMIIGIALASVRSAQDWNWRFLSATLLIKYVVWPLATFAVLAVWQLFLPLDPLTAKVIVLTSVLPMAANVVAFASLLKAEPEKVALATTVSTVVSIFLIPVMLPFLFELLENLTS